MSDQPESGNKWEIYAANVVQWFWNTNRWQTADIRIAREDFSELYSQLCPPDILITVSHNRPGYLYVFLMYK